VDSSLCDGCHVDVDFLDAGLDSLGEDGMKLAVDSAAISTAGVLELE
jgi:hypothetical protein